MYGSWSGVGGELGEGVGLDIKIDGDSHKKKINNNNNKIMEIERPLFN